MRWSIAFLAVMATLLVGCVSTTTVQPAPPPSSARAAKLHLRDGRLVVLDDFDVHGTEIRGHGREYGVERDLVRSGALSIQSVDIALVETTRRRLNYAVIPMVLVTGVSAAASVICLANTTACFGATP